jgi:hypothetical protein
MEPLRQADRLVKAIEDTATSVRGLPLPSTCPLRMPGCAKIREVIADRQRYCEIA